MRTVQFQVRDFLFSSLSFQFPFHSMEIILQFWNNGKPTTSETIQFPVASPRMTEGRTKRTNGAEILNAFRQSISFPFFRSFFSSFSMGIYATMDTKIQITISAIVGICDRERMCLSPIGAAISLWHAARAQATADVIYFVSEADILYKQTDAMNHSLYFPVRIAEFHNKLFSFRSGNRFVYLAPLWRRAQRSLAV